jgi:uncharacterized membrane protein (DUF485 family)
MNIKVKAGLDVVKFLVIVIAGAAGIRFALDTLADTFGAENTIHGLMLGGLFFLVYFVVSLLYDVRLAQLNYEEKLKEITKK